MLAKGDVAGEPPGIVVDRLAEVRAELTNGYEMELHVSRAPSGIHSAKPVHRCYPLDGLHVRADSHVDAVAASHAGYLVERLHHNAFQPLIDSLLVPEIPTAV